jgi:iron-sulfur cluster assembly protein
MVTLTDAASAKLAELLSQQENVLGLRLSAMAGGCSGYQYGMEFAESEREGDWVGTFGTVKVYVAADSQPMLTGVKVDYVETLERTGFTIHNPNAVRGCGCGKSFETEESASSGQGHHHSH